MKYRINPLKPMKILLKLTLSAFLTHPHHLVTALPSFTEFLPSFSCMIMEMNVRLYELSLKMNYRVLPSFFFWKKSLYWVLPSFSFSFFVFHKMTFLLYFYRVFFRFMINVGLTEFLPSLFYIFTEKNRNQNQVPLKTAIGR